MSLTTINNFEFLFPLVFFGTIAAINDAHGTILCSQCDSRKDNYFGECERYPPEPRACAEHGESVFCSIVREIDFEGIQLLFARGCAATHSDEKCFVKNITNGSTIRQKNVCYRTCVTSGCNSESLSARGASSRLKLSCIVLALFVFFAVYINSYYQLLIDQIK